MQLCKQVAINNTYKNNPSRGLLVINDMYNNNLNKSLLVII